MDTQVLEGVYVKIGVCEECDQDTTPFYLLLLSVLNSSSMGMTTVFVGGICPVCHSMQEKEVEFDDPDYFYAQYPAMRAIGELLRKHDAAHSPIDWPTDEMNLSYAEKVVLSNSIRYLAERQYRRNEFYLPRLAMGDDLSSAINEILDK